MTCNLPSVSSQEIETGPLDPLLVRFANAARAAWPGLSDLVEPFARRLADRLPPDRVPERWLEKLYVDDLYLAFACERLERAALDEFERRYVSEFATYLPRSQHEVLDDVTQQVRERLLVTGRIASYAGQGPLGGWVRTVVLRTALNIGRARGSSRRAEARKAGEIAAHVDPEIEILKEHYRPFLRDALMASVAALSRERRDILRMYFLEGMTLAAIGKALQLHESTIARQVTSIRRLVLENTERSLASFFGVEASEARSIVRLAASRLNVSVLRALAGRGDCTESAS